MTLEESGSFRGRNPSNWNVEEEEEVVVVVVAVVAVGEKAKEELDGLMGLPLSPKANNMASEADLRLSLSPGDEGTTGSKDELGEKCSSGR